MSSDENVPPRCVFQVDLDPTDDGDLIGTAVPGVRLELWNASVTSWEQVAMEAFDVDAPGIVAYQPASAEVARDFTAAGLGRFFYRLRPAAGQGNGPEPPVVGIDSVELHIEHRLSE